MKKKFLKKVFMIFLLIFSTISVASLGFNIEIPAHISSGLVKEWVTISK